MNYPTELRQGPERHAGMGAQLEAAKGHIGPVTGKGTDRAWLVVGYAGELLVTLDRLPSLSDQLDRALIEILVELPITPRHRQLISSKAMSPRYEGKPIFRFSARTVEETHASCPRRRHDSRQPDRQHEGSLE